MSTNNPPSPIEYAASLASQLSDWMADHPVVQTEEDSKEAKTWLDRAKAAFEEVETERVGKVKPLNDEVAKVNAIYKALHNTDTKKPGTFDKIVGVLKQRIQAYLLIEETKRRRIAEEKAAAADAAREAALKAEALEREAKENASVGEVGIEIGKWVVAADEAFNEAMATQREAARAYREAEHVRLGGGFGKSISVRSVEVLEIADWNAAIVSMGLTDNVRDAILTSARAFRSATGDLPEGVEARFERKL